MYVFWNQNKRSFSTWHLFSCGGFIFDPTGQLKSREKSSMLENGPCSWKTDVNEGKNKRLFLAFLRLSWTRNWSGLWTPVRTRSFSAFGRYLAHQTFAAETFKNTMVMRFGWWIPSKVVSPVRYIDIGYRLSIYRHFQKISISISISIRHFWKISVSISISTRRFWKISISISISTRTF